MKARMLIYSGIYALIGIILAKKLFFSYYYGDEGINLLPINFFEMVLFVMSILIVIITFLTVFISAKRRKIKIPIKVKRHLFFFFFIGGVVLTILLQYGYNSTLVPTALIIYGIIIIYFQRFLNSNLLLLALAELILGITLFFVENNTWLFLILGFGIFPILFGITELKKGKAIF